MLRMFRNPRVPKTEMLEVLVELVDRRLAGGDPQGGSESGLEDRPLCWSGVKACAVSLGRACKSQKGKRGDLFSPRPRFLSESVGQFAVEDDEATGASF